jgi:hypothetical protein
MASSPKTEMNCSMKKEEQITKMKMIGLFVVGLLALGLSGCATNQVRTQGTITAVNVSGQTIEIKTDAGQPQTVSLTASTTLYNGDSTWRKTVKLDYIQPGQYLLVYQKLNPEGKLVADWGGVFSHRPENVRGSPETGPVAASTAPSTVSGAPVAPAAVQTPVPATAAAPAAPIPGFQAGDTLPTNKAVIYFYRPVANMVFGTDVKLAVPVKVNGQLINALRQGGYFACLADPGTIELGSCELPGFMAPKSVFSMTLQVQVGQAYYIKGAHGKGMGGRAHLASVPPETGASEMASCQLMPPLTDELRNKIEGGGK